MLEVRGLTKQFGALRASDGIDFDVAEGETHAVIGPNGAGKTTFISQLAGNLRPDSGTVRFAGADITALAAPRRARLGLARSFQITSVYPDFSALHNVALAIQAHSGHSFRFWRDARSDPALIQPARKVLDEVGLSSRVGVSAANLSHGEQRQLEVAMALATEPRLLLLDEPMAGMGVEESQRMIALLARLKQAKTIILVEHDMDAVFRLADRISLLVYGRLIATEPTEKIRANEEVRRAYLGEDCCSTSANSRPPMAAARSCSASTSLSARAKWSRCWDATAWARRPPCARSWGSLRLFPGRSSSRAASCSTCRPTGSRRPASAWYRRAARCSPISRCART